MRMVVKPHQAFFLAARTDHAAGLMPMPRVPALLPSILSPPPPSPPPPAAAGAPAAGKECSSPHQHPARLPVPGGRQRFRSVACASVRAPGPDDRLSVGGRPRPPAPYAVYASGVRHASSKGPSIERTVPSQVTRRQNDGPYRPRLALPRRLTPRRRYPLPVGSRGHAAPFSGQRRGGLGVPPPRRIDPQAPALPPGPFGPLAAPQVAPQRDQQLAGQRDDAHLPRPPVPRPEAPVVPRAERAARLPAQPQPGQLHDQRPHVPVARLADPLLALALPAVIRRRRQAHQRPQLLAALDPPPGEQLGHQDPGAAHAHRLEPQQPAHLLQVRLLPLAQPPPLRVGRVARLPVQRLPHREL